MYLGLEFPSAVLLIYAVGKSSPRLFPSLRSYFRGRIFTRTIGSIFAVVVFPRSLQINSAFSFRQADFGKGQ